MILSNSQKRNLPATCSSSTPPLTDCAEPDRKFESLDQTSVLNEVRLLEMLRDHLHPNVVVYHGCIVRDGWITGLVLSKHDRTLQAVLDDVARGAAPDVPTRQHLIRGVAEGSGICMH